MELYHHGILGQKWGIRRYQNKDGSLTAEGIKRYRTDLKFKAKYDKQTKAREAKRIEVLMNKDVRKLTDEELAERIRRLDMEKRVKDLERGIGGNNSNNQQRQDSSGEQRVNAGKNFVKKAGVDLLNTTTKLAVKYAANKIMKSIFKDYTDDSDKKKDKNNDGDNNNNNNNKNKNNNSNNNSNSGSKNKNKGGDNDLFDWKDTDVFSKYSYAAEPKKQSSKSVGDEFYDRFNVKRSSKYGDVTTTGYWTNSSLDSFWSDGGTTSVSNLGNSTWYSSGKKETKNIVDSVGSVSIKDLGNYSDFYSSTTGGKDRVNITDLGNYSDWYKQFK